MHEISKIIRHALGRPATSITPILGKGEVSQAISVQVGSDELVIKLNSPGDDPADALRLFQKEEWCIEQATRLGIPGPQVVATGKRRSRAYMIQHRLSGVQATDYQGDLRSVWNQLGRYAKLIHSIPVNGYGAYLTSPEQAQFDGSWEAQVDWYVHYLFDDDFFLRHHIFQRDQIDRARSRLLQLFEWQFDPFLNHGGLSLKNAIVADDGTVQVIDWGGAIAHRVPHMDLSKVFAWWPSEDFQSLLDGYGISKTEFEAMQFDLETLALQWLLNAVKWTSDHRKDWQQVPFVQRAIEKINHFV